MHNWKLFSYFSTKTCCGYPKHLLKLMDKKIIAILRWHFVLNWPYVLLICKIWLFQISWKKNAFTIIISEIQALPYKTFTVVSIQFNGKVYLIQMDKGSACKNSFWVWERNRKIHPDDHHVASRDLPSMTNGDSEGQILLSHTHTNDGFFFCSLFDSAVLIEINSRSYQLRWDGTLHNDITLT